MKRRLDVALPTGMGPLWSLGIVMRVEAKVIVVVGWFVVDEECLGDGR